MSSASHSEEGMRFSNFLPAGVILPFAGDIPPEGFLICNGCSISRKLYPNLFNVIGTKYGSENEAFFNLPNLTDRFIQGASEKNKLGSYLSPSLPNIKGTISSYMHYSTDSNLFQISRGIGDNFGNKSPGGYPHDTAFTFNANRYNGIYKDECKTVQPNALCLNYIIKY
jgi:microcystin-dependent protein